MNLKVVKKKISKKTEGIRDQKGKRRGGFYWNGENPYLTVTEILKIIDKPALRYWFGKQVYYAMAINPNLSESEAMASPYKTSRKAITRGLAVHKIIEAYKNTEDHVKSIPKKYRGYAEGFYKFFNHYKAKIIESERTVFSEKERYAGTLDLLLLLNGDQYPYVVDVKTGKNIYDEAFLQTSAYATALEEINVKTSGVAVLLLKPDSTYTFEIKNQSDIKTYFKGFISAKSLYEVINREKLLKFGYLRGGDLYYGQEEA